MFSCTRRPNFSPFAKFPLHVPNLHSKELEEIPYFLPVLLEICDSFSFSPFWSEDFTFDVPREFHTLAFYLYEKDKLKWSDNIIGKVPFRKDELHQFKGKDQWFSLVNVDADTEVQVRKNL